MTAECPVIPKKCDSCDYRLARKVDYSAKLMCELCANYNGDEDE